ncbi:MAG: hypothetical protein RL095_2969 [Verrucomicrobiota bacterium]|jgi:predicted metal-dependent HD superfamily phosphohydrolase
MSALDRGGTDRLASSSQRILLRWPSLPPSLFTELRAAWLEPQRFYHTLQHLGECLAILAEVAPQAREEVLLALWFHDAVYDPRAKGNEEASAAWAERVLRPIDAAAAKRVAELVLATRHEALPADPEAALLVDVDLAILAADAARFAEYERQVRQEYSWVSEADFCAGRSRILRHFLERPFLYSTPELRQRWETRARTNLTAALKELGDA